VGELVVEHCADERYGVVIARVWVPGEHRVSQKCKRAGGVVLEIRVGLQVFTVEHAGDEIQRQAGDFIRWQLVFKKVLGITYDVVVAERLVGAMPRQQLALRVEQSVVPRELGDQIGLS
jgi:hypothetical protein